MPDADSDEFVELTHFINPHLFWLRKCIAFDREFERIECELQQYAMQKHESVQFSRQPILIKRGDRVGVYFVAWKKWLRCDVDVIDRKGENYILWAIDYGFPFRSTKKLIVILESSRLETICTNRIVRAGLPAVVPFKGTPNLNSASRPVQRERWPSAAVDILAQIKNLKIRCKFSPNSTRFGETNVGELIIHAEKGRMKFLSDTLVELKLAKSTTDEVKLAKSFGKTAKIDRWLNNAGEIHSDCILNEGNVLRAKSASDSGSVKSTCSEEDVLNYFKTRQRNAGKLQSKTNGALISEKSKQPVHSEEGAKPKKAVAPSAVAYTSLAKGKNDVAQRPGLNAPAVVSHPWTNGETSTREVQNGLNSTSGLKLSNNIKTAVRQQQKNDLRNIGETKMQTFSARIFRAHSNAIRIKPVQRITEAPFTEEIHRQLRTRFRETYISQAYAWPHLMRGNSLILIDSKNRGKTIAYLPALCSRLQIHMDDSSGVYDKTRLTMGPKAIILCANASAVESIARLCRLFMNRLETEVVQAIGARNIREVAAKLFNGCSIFVTTAPCLSKLMDSHSDVFDAQKLSFFVFDNADMIISRHGEERLATIFKKFGKPSKDASTMNTLVAVTARTWHPAFKKMCNHMTNPLLLIGNSLEAACYGNMNIQVSCTFEAKKMDLVYEHIETIQLQTERLLVVCNESNDAIQLSKFLTDKELPHKCITRVDPSNKKTLKQFYELYWENNEGVFICTDETIKEFGFMNAQHVIQFSMPERFTDFLFRLSASIDCYPNIVETSNETVCRTSTLFLVDEKNNKQLPRLINLLERKGEKFPERVQEICQKIRILNDSEKAEKLRFESVCNFLFMHGHSNHESTCRERHLLTPTDVPLPASAIPPSGAVRLKIMHIFSPTRYSVQLLTKYQSANRACDSNNHRDLLIPELGQLCAIEDNDRSSNTFHRGRIILINERKSLCADDFDVDVRLIDVGTVVRRKSAELRQLAAAFCDFAEQAVDLHLIGLVPTGLEDEWDSEITNALKNRLNEIGLERNDIHVEANVVFSLRNAVIVDCLRVSQSIGSDCSILCSVKKHITQCRFGVGSKEIRVDVIKMAATIGVVVKSQNLVQVKDEQHSISDTNSCDDMTSVKSETKNTESDQKSINLIDLSSMASKSSPNVTAFATLEQNPSQPSEESSEKWAKLSDTAFANINVSTYYAPDHFYVVLEDDEFGKLLDDIDKYVEQYDGQDTSMEMPDIGNYCLAKVNGKYNRAKILSNFCENGRFCAKVFCCDIGDIINCEIENIMSIPDYLLHAMPFQAIWCRFFGIKSNESKTGEWEAIDFKIYDDIIESSHDLTAKLISSYGMRPITDDSPFEIEQFNVILMSKEGAINQRAVELELAAFETDAERIINTHCEVDSDDTDSEDEEWKAAGVVRQSPVQRVPVQDDSELLRALQSDLLDVNFDMGDFADCLDESVRDLFQAPTAIEADLKNLNAIDAKEKKDDQKIVRCDSASDSDNCEEITFAQQIINKLQYKHRVPYVTWKQTDELIFLSIKADESVAYNLDVTSKRLIFNAEIREETNLLIINFFGTVDEMYTSHEVRGLNVVVRLVKSTSEWAWPQLIAENVKCHWLSYDYNAIRNDEIDLDQAKFVFNAKNKPNDEPDSDDNESDSDCDDDRAVYDDSNA